MGLSQYNRKRDFKKTLEPRGVRPTRTAKKRIFVIQKHAASRLHYDFRLEHNGVLLSWAVPKGPSYNPADKRLAVHVEDHPIEYAKFEGSIPEGEYGGGTVIIWDRGTWKPLTDDIEGGLEKGKIAFELTGEKLVGAWTLVRMRLAARGEKDQWLLIKERDEEVKACYDVTTEEPKSVKSGLTIEEATLKYGEKRARKKNPAEKKSEAKKSEMKNTMKKTRSTKKT